MYLDRWGCLSMRCDMIGTDLLFRVEKRTSASGPFRAVSGPFGAACERILQLSRMCTCFGDLDDNSFAGGSQSLHSLPRSRGISMPQSCTVEASDRRLAEIADPGPDPDSESDQSLDDALAVGEELACHAFESKVATFVFTFESAVHTKRGALRA